MEYFTKNSNIKFYKQDWLYTKSGLNNTMYH